MNTYRGYYTMHKSVLQEIGKMIFMWIVEKVWKRKIELEIKRGYFNISLRFRCWRWMILKVKKNTFEKMCDKLEEQYLQDIDEITFVEKYIKEKIDQERNKLMKIRAEAREDDFLAFQSIMLNAVALIVALMGIAY